jgi:hypothetical protein
MYLVTELVPGFQVDGGVGTRLLLYAVLAGLWTLTSPRPS